MMSPPIPDTFSPPNHELSSLFSSLTPFYPHSVDFERFIRFNAPTMRDSLQPTDVTNPISLVEAPFEAYTDSPCSMSTTDVKSIDESVVGSCATVQVAAIPHTKVGLRIGKWRHSLGSFIQSWPWFATRKSHREEAFPLLSEDTSNHQKRCRNSWVKRWLLQGLLGFFVVL